MYKNNLCDKGVIKSDEVTVAYITGNGLKTQEAIAHVPDQLSTEPDYESCKIVLENTF